MTRKTGRTPSSKTNPEPQGRLRASWAALLLAAIGLLAYSGTFEAELAQDARGRILKDPRVQSVSASNLRQIVTEDYWWPIHESGLYRPLTTLSYLVNYAVLGHADRPAGYHAVNLGLHWLNALLVFFLVRGLTHNAWSGFFPAALFTAHPVATEAVTNIVGRADLLAAAAVLGGVLLYRQARRLAGAGNRRWWVLLSAIMLLGLFSKEVAIVLPGVLFLYEVTLRLSATPQAQDEAMGLGSLSRRAAMALGLPLAFWAFVRTQVLGGVLTTETPFVDNPLVASGFWEARATAVQVLGDYLRLLLWPVGLSNDYSYNQIPVVNFSKGGWENGTWLLSALVIAGLLTLAALYRRRSPAFFFAFFAFIGILPVSNLLVLIGSIRADRFLYLPSIGFTACLTLVVFGAGRFLGRSLSSRNTQIGGAVFLGAVVLLYGGLARGRNLDWRSDLHLWTQAVETSPDSFRTHHALAYLIYRQDPENDRLDEVIERQERAASILAAGPLQPVDLPVGVPAQLAAYYLIQAERTPAESTTWRRRAVEQLLLARRADQAMRQRLLERRLARGDERGSVPVTGQHDVYFNLGLAYERLGELPAALEAYSELRLLDPARARYSWNIASVHLARSDFEEAAVLLHQVLLLAPSATDIPPLLRDAYASIDPEGCAWSAAGLDAGCPRVQEDRCRALEGLESVHRLAGRPEQAARWRQQALEQPGCGARSPSD